MLEDRSRQLALAGLLEQHVSLTKLGAALLPRETIPFEPRQGGSRTALLAVAAAVLIGVVVFLLAGPTPTPTDTASATPTPTRTIASPTPVAPAETPRPTATPAPSPSPRVTTDGVRPTPSATRSASPTPGPTATPTPSPIASLSPTPRPTPTPTPTPSKTAEPVPSAAVVAQVVRVEGRAFGGETALATGARVRVGQALRTEADGLLALSVSDGSRIEAAGGVRFVCAQSPGLKVALQAGRLAFDVKRQRKKDRWQVITPHAQVTVLGTAFTVEVSDAATRVDVRKGRVGVRRAGGGRQVTVRKGRFVIVRDGAPLKVRKQPKGPRRPRGVVLFSEDFERLTPGGWPTGWSKPRKPEAARLEVTRAGKNTFLRSLDQAGRKAQKGSAPVPALAPPFTIAFRFKNTGKRSFRTGLNLWNEVDQRRYGVDYSPAQSRLAVFDTNHDKELLGEARASVPLTGWHAFRARFTPGQVVVGLDGKDALTVKLPKVRFEQLWLVSLGKDPAQFDDLIVTRP